MNEPHNTHAADGESLCQGDATVPSLALVRGMVRRALSASSSGELTLNDLSDSLRSQLPGFRPGDYGCSKLTTFLTRRLSDLVEVRADRATNGSWARLIAEPQTAEAPTVESQPRPKPEVSAAPRYPLEQVRAKAIDVLKATPAGRMNLSQLATTLTGQLPGWRPNHYGCARLSSFLTRQMGDLLVLSEDTKTSSVFAELKSVPIVVTPAASSPLPYPIERVQQTALEILTSATEGRLLLSRLAQAMTERLPGWRPNHYGCSCLSSFLGRKMSDSVTLERDGKKNNLYARAVMPTRENKPIIKASARPTIKATPQPAPQPKTERPAKQKAVRTVTEKRTTAPTARLSDDDRTALGNFATIDDSQYRRLAMMALPEPWEFTGDPALSILKEYLRATFGRLRRQNALTYDRKKEAAAFDTGLLDHNCDPIFAYFGRRGDGWELLDFCLAGQGQYGKPLLRDFPSLPSRATYYRSADDLIYDLGGGAPQVDWNHVLVDKVSRIPAEVLRLAGLEVPSDVRFLQDLTQVRACRRTLRSDPLVHRRLKSIFEGAIDLIMKRLRYDYRLAVPIYRVSRQTLALALPLDLTASSRIDLALVCEHIGTVGYQGHTIYPLRWVYRSARVLFRPTVAWLDPLNLPPAPVLQDEDGVTIPSSETRVMSPRRTTASRRKGRAKAAAAAVAAGAVDAPERQSRPEPPRDAFDATPRPVGLSSIWNLFRRKK